MTRIGSLLIAGMLLLILAPPTSVSAQNGPSLDPAARELYAAYLRLTGRDYRQLIFERGTYCRLPDPAVVADISSQYSALESNADDLAATTAGYSRLMALTVARNARNNNWQLTQIDAVSLPDWCG